MKFQLLCNRQKKTALLIEIETEDRLNQLQVSFPFYMKMYFSFQQL